MTEASFIWDASGGGDASPHSEADVAAMFADIAGVAGVANAGVLHGLAPSAIAGNTQVRVASGAAIVDGHPYRNTANIDTTPVTPSTGTTGRRLVLRANWAAQTVRLVELSSADGTAAIPALTQSSGTTYEIPIASYTVTTAGVVGAFSDDRLLLPNIDLDYVLNPWTRNNNAFTWWSPSYGANAFPAGTTTLVGIGASVAPSGTNNQTQNNDGTVTIESVGGAASAAFVHGFLARPDAVARMVLEFRGAVVSGAASTSHIIGFSSVQGASDTNNLIAFRSLATGNVFAVCDSGGTETAVDTGIAQGAALHTFRVEVIGGTTVRFFVDGVQVGSDFTSNIPATTLLRTIVGQRTPSSAMTMTFGPMFAFAEAA